MKVESIRANTPKAYTKLVKWIGAGDQDILQFEMAMLLKNERDLYDFFDEMGIIIGIVIGNDNMDKTHPPIFEYEIFQGGKEVAHDDDCHFMRKEAETSAFTEAWKILEKQ